MSLHCKVLQCFVCLCRHVQQMQAVDRINVPSNAPIRTQSRARSSALKSRPAVMQKVFLMRLRAVQAPGGALVQIRGCRTARMTQCVSARQLRSHNLNSSKQDAVGCIAPLNTAAAPSFQLHSAWHFACPAKGCSRLAHKPKLACSRDDALSAREMLGNGAYNIEEQQCRSWGAYRTWARGFAAVPWSQADRSRASKPGLAI